MALAATTLLTRLQSRLKLRHLQALLALYDLRGIGRAAQALRITQPAMSQLLVEMEKLLETPLFLRHSKGVDPTPAALDLIPIAMRILEATEEAAERLASRQSRQTGVVRIAATAASEGAILDLVLPDFALRHPQVKVQTVSVLGLSLDAAFAGDEHDIVCCRQRAVLPDGWRFEPFVADEMIAVCGAAHPLAGEKAVSRRALSRATWMQNHVATMARSSFEALVEAEGWSDVAEVRMHARTAPLIWTMLRGGRYVTLVPRSVVAPWLRAGLLVELPAALGLHLPPMGYLWCESEVGPAARQFLDRLAAQAEVSPSPG